MTDDEISLRYGALLATLAARSLENGVLHGRPLPTDPEDYPEALRVTRATFVTLEEDGALRGCIGSVVARRSLVEDVAVNAFGAGFGDPRFPPLRAPELDALAVGISILSPFERVDAASEDELFAQARVGVDGFMLSADERGGLFLPQVWEILPTRERFFDALREKAGLPRDHWPPELKIERFQVTSVPKRRIEQLLTPFG